jgi:DNA-binding response OmpR family regulator
MPPVVLIVENDEALGHGLRLALKSHGFETIVARDGAAALTTLNVRRPDLIITDLQTPFFSGEELLDVCGTDPRLKGVPTIALSDASGRGAVPAATRTLHKPFDLEQLIQTVRALIPAAPS